MILVPATLSGRSLGRPHQASGLKAALIDEPNAHPGLSIGAKALKDKTLLAIGTSVQSWFRKGVGIVSTLGCLVVLAPGIRLLDDDPCSQLGPLLHRHPSFLPVTF